MEKIIDFLKKIGSFIFALVVGFVSALLFRGGVRDNRERTESTGEQLNEVAGGLAEVRGGLAEARGTVEESLGIIDKVRKRKKTDN